MNSNKKKQKLTLANGKQHLKFGIKNIQDA
jgi:hypothetical protein